MNNEATLNINGQDIRMLYTAAAEKGFEDMTGQSSAVFMNNGKIYDWVTLGLACIVAAYAKKDEEPPVKDTDLMNEASPLEIATAFATFLKLRGDFYHLPAGEPEDKSPVSDDKATVPGASASGKRKGKAKN